MKENQVNTILIINPGSTSTKIALYSNMQEEAGETISHSSEELQQYSSVAQQKNFRLALVRDFLKRNSDLTKSIHGVIGRGGLLRPLSSGVYQVNQAMIEELLEARNGEHACNLGAPLAAEIAKEKGCPAFIADPVVIDEMEDLARFSGLPEIIRKSAFHALNQKSAARKIASRLNREYIECNFIVAHMGGGISVGAHKKGNVIDVNDALDGDGPFSPERSGGLPVGQLVQFAYENRHRLSLVKKKLVGRGGLMAYLGTNSLREIDQRIREGDTLAGEVFRAMAYQISKEIAMHGATLKGQIDGIILTGGMAHNKDLIGEISDRVAYLAPIFVLPGEREMEALAENALAALTKKKEVKQYPP